MSGNINFNGWINDDGSENYKCRAWVNFNGTGTVAIRDSGNVSSITDNGTGDYTVNFTTAMTDENYCPQIACGTGANQVGSTRSFSTTSLQVRTAVSQSAFSALDVGFITIAIFR
jgi:hypothetical protein